MSTSLKGKVCVVTGASGEIGSQIAHRLKVAGASVIGWGNSRPPSGDLDLVLQADVSSELDIQKAFCEIDSKFSQIDVLVTAAGISESKLSMKLSEAEWLALLQINLTGSWLCAREASKRMILQKRGSILFVSSLAARRPHAGQAAYAASKGAIESLTRTLAVELAPKNIRVNALSPGFVEGNMTGGMDESIREKTRSRIPLARFATPVEIAAAAHFLVSEDASYITAQILDVSGGLGM